MAKCPHCKQLMPHEYKPQKICAECKKPIERGHKWHWIKKRGLATIAHRHCDNPDSYKPRETKI